MFPNTLLLWLPCFILYIFLKYYIFHFEGDMKSKFYPAGLNMHSSIMQDRSAAVNVSQRAPSQRIRGSVIQRQGVSPVDRQTDRLTHGPSGSTAAWPSAVACTWASAVACTWESGCQDMIVSPNMSVNVSVWSSGRVQEQEQRCPSACLRVCLRVQMVMHVKLCFVLCYVACVYACASSSSMANEELNVPSVSHCDVWCFFRQRMWGPLSLSLSLSPLLSISPSPPSSLPFVAPLSSCWSAPLL